MAKQEVQQITTSDFYQLMRFIYEKQSIGYKLDLFNCVENFTVRTVTMVREVDIEDVAYVESSVQAPVTNGVAEGGEPKASAKGKSAKAKADKPIDAPAPTDSEGDNAETGGE